MEYEKQCLRILKYLKKKNSSVEFETLKQHFKYGGDIYTYINELQDNDLISSYELSNPRRVFYGKSALADVYLKNRMIKQILKVLIFLLSTVVVILISWVFAKLTKQSI